MLATVVASLGTLGAASAQAAQATPQSAVQTPTVLELTAAGSTTPITVNQNGSFYVNDTTDSQRVTVTGAPNADVKLSVDSGQIVSQTADTTGVADFTIPALSKGDHTLAVTQAEGGQTSAPADFTVHSDTVPTVSGIQDGSTIYDQFPSVTVNGAIPNGSVSLSDDEGGAVTTADAQGNITMSVGNFLSPGQHTISVVTMDDDHHPSSASTITFTVALPTPTLKGVADGETLVTGSPAIGDDAPGTYSSTLYVNGEKLTDDMGGSFEDKSGVSYRKFTLPSDLLDGQYTLTATDTDGNGNEGPQSAPVTISIHSAPPALDAALNGTTSPSAQPTIHITGGRPNGHGNVYVDMNDSQFRFPAGQVRFGADGTATYQVPWLSNDQHSVYVTNVDSENNESAPSNTVTFTVNAVPPTAPTVVSPTDGSTVTTNEPTISATSDPGVTICFTVDAGAPNEVDLPCRTADGNGQATSTPSSPLGDGWHRLSVVATDAYNNTNETDTSFTVDTSGNNAGDNNSSGGRPTQAPPTPKSVSLSSHSLSAAHPVKVGFTLSKPGTLVLSLTEQVKTTVKVKVKTKVHGKTATVTETVTRIITKVVGTVNINVKKAGKASYTLTTKFAGHKLGKGNYTLSLQTTSGKSKSKPVTQTLSVH